MTQLRTAGVILALALLTTAPISSAAPGAPTPTPDLTIGPLQSGASSYVRGHFVWTDYAYDDHGANAAAGEAGAAAYPDAQDQGNAADLIQLQARLIRDELRITAVLETLTRADEPLLGIGFDTDGKSATGAATLPGGRWRNSGALGLDYFLTASSDGGQLLRWSGGAWSRVAPIQTRVSAATNTVTASVSVAALKAHKKLRAVAVLGLRRASASWLTGTGPIFDLAFVRAEEPPHKGLMLVPTAESVSEPDDDPPGSPFQDARQADVLAGRLPASNAVATLDLDAMRSGRTSLPRLDTPGYHTMIYHSEVALPEGIVEGTEAGGLWAGPYQPYLVQVPQNPTPGLPVLLYLHGGGQTHLNNGMFAPQGQLSIGRSLAVFPYGREPTTAQDHGYEGASEKDVLDVLADVRRHYRTDPDRTVVAGVSTGGGGAFRMAQVHPDLFSGVLVISAYDDTHLAENLINMPVVLHNGGADPLVSPPVAAATYAELDQLGNVGYRAYMAAGHSHGDPAAAISQCLLNQLLAKRIVRNPARVVLVQDPWVNPDNDLPAGTDLGHGDAYWLSDVRIRPGASVSMWHTPAGRPPAYGDNGVARIDVTSLSHSVRAVVATPVNGAGENLTAGATMCGPAPSVRTNDTWTLHGLDLAPGAPLPVSNGATVTMREVSAATLDLTRMRLSVRRPLRLSVTGDGPATLTLAGDWAGPVRVLVDGKHLAQIRPIHGRIAFSTDLTGSHEVELVSLGGT